ncbi:MAG: hypothetical protein NZ455_14450 [Bacteroidia bacterium]|nr:hypothetical protein [Bacteroidia bacterium]
MRHAKGKPSGLVRSPLPRGWGVAPLARSTPTLWAYAQRMRPQGHAKKVNLLQ